MSDSRPRFERLREEYDESDLFLIAGLSAAIAAWIRIPLLSVLAVYCGYRLYVNYDRTTSGSILIVLGAAQLVRVALFVATQG
jgi:hypothetical protein